MSRRIDRLEMGEAWMMCNECGAKLYSFDGHQDRSKPCPYYKNDEGQCTDTLKY